MELGYAFFEQLIIEEWKTLNTTFLDYKMPSALDMLPTNEYVSIETYEPEGPFGAKQTGESLALCTAPAIAEAVHHAITYWCKDLPITPEKILKMRQENISYKICTLLP